MPDQQEWFKLGGCGTIDPNDFEVVCYDSGELAETMSDHEAHDVEIHPPSTRVPPTERGAMQRPTQSVWPMVVGVIAIVLGALGLLSGCAGIASMVFFEAMSNVVGEEDIAEFQAMREWLAFTVASSIVWMALSVVLIIGAIGLVMRRRWAVKTCLTWAVLKIIYELAIIAPSIQMQSAQMSTAMEDASADSGGQTDQFAHLFEVFAWGGVLLGTLVGIALPIFLIIWFRRDAIRAETANWA